MDNFDRIYNILGGKLLHLADYIQEFQESGIEVEQCSHVLQAYNQVSIHLSPPFPPPPSTLSTAPPSSLANHLECCATEEPHTLPLMRRLVSDDGPLSFFTARKEFGRKMVDTLIAARLAEVEWVKPIASVATGEIFLLI